MINVGADFGSELGPRHQANLVRKFGSEQPRRFLEFPVMGWLGRERQVSAASKVTVDPLLVHEPLDRVHRGERGIEELPRQIPDRNARSVWRHRA